MNPSYRSTAHAGYNSAGSTSLTITKPTGLAVDDVLVAVIHQETTTSQAVNCSGFTIERSSIASLGGNAVQLSVIWKRATASDVAATNFAFTYSIAGYATGDLHAFSGCITSGNPFPASNIIGDNSGSTTIRSIDYTTAAGLGVWIYTEYTDSSSVTLPSGYTLAASSNDGDLRLAQRIDTSGMVTSGTGSRAATAVNGVFAGTLVTVAPTMSFPAGWLSV